MAKLLRSRMIQDETVTAGAAVRSDDLPVNPLSAVLLTILARVTAVNTHPTLSNLLAVLSRVEVLYKGQSIVSASLHDLYALAYYLLGRAPHQLRRDDTAAAARIGVTIPILFGRQPYDLNECFPAVRRGELQLQTTPAASFTALDTVTLQVETVELLDAAPKSFLKATTISKTPSAAGDHDVDLPIGNPILGIMLFATTVPTTASSNASINQVRTLVDNVEHGYALTNWETMKGGDALTTNADWQGAELHSRLGAGAPAANDATEPVQWPTHTTRQYAWLDYDPTRNGAFALDTQGRARVHLRINADDAQAIRVIPVERLAIQAATA